MSHRPQSNIFSIKQRYHSRAVDVLPVLVLLQIDAALPLGDMYYRLLQINKIQKIIFFLPLLYRDNLYKGNIRLCQQIQNIFRNSIRDPTIMNEFSFYFELELVQKKILKDNKNNNKVILSLRQINQFLKSMKTNEFYLINHALSIIWNKVQELENQPNIDLNFLYSQNGLITRFFLSIKQSFLNDFKTVQTKNHKCSKIIRYHSWMIMSKKISRQYQEQTKETLLRIARQKGKFCKKCQNIKRLIIIIDELHQLLTSFSKNRVKMINFIKQSNESIIQNFFKLYTIFCKEISIKQSIMSQQIRLIQNGLLYGQLFCSLIPQMEDLYKGIENYYKFLQKYNILDHYFQIRGHYLKFTNILQLLKKKGLQNLSYFLYQISCIFLRTSNLKWYTQFQADIFSMMLNMKQTQLQQVFACIRQIRLNRQNHQKQNKYICLIYIFLHVFLQQTLSRKSLIIGLKKIEKIHFHFRRKGLIIIFHNLIGILVKTKNKRKIIFYNNKLVKLLMIDGQTVPSKVKNKSNNYIQKFLCQKMNRIEKWTFARPPLKFMKKKK